jgi:Flp pilus assembly protein protease CpaA
MFVVLVMFYSTGWMGGGDVKILAVAFLWTSLFGALPFAILLAMFSGLHSIAAKFWRSKTRSPLAVVAVFHSRRPLQVP